MKKIQLAAFIAAAGLMLGSAYAAGLDAPVPPSFNDAPDNIQRPSKSGETIEEKVTDLNQKNPDIVNSKAGKKDTKAEEAQSKKDLKAAQSVLKILPCGQRLKLKRPLTITIRSLK